MAKVKVRYLVQLPGRAGAKRLFWEPGGQMRALGWRATRLSDDLAMAIAQAAAINSAVDAWRRGALAEVPPEHLGTVLAAAPAGLVKGDNRQPGSKEAPICAKPGTMSALIASYRRHEDFLELRATTRKGYEDNLRALERWCGDAPIFSIGPTELKDHWRLLRKTTPSKAKAVMGMARILFGWARREAGYKGWIDGGVLVQGNPAEQLNIKSARVERTEDDLWTDCEIAIFSAIADSKGWHSIGTAVELNGWMGQREGDVLALPASRYRDGALDVAQSKTGARVFLPIDMVPELKKRLEDQRERQRTGIGANVAQLAPPLLICESTGAAWNENTFRHKIRDIRTEAAKWCPSLATKQFMLLRHTAIVRLAESGCTAEDIHNVSGHSLETVNSIMARYLVRTKKAAETAFRKRLLALQGEG